MSLARAWGNAPRRRERAGGTFTNSGDRGLGIAVARLMLESGGERREIKVAGPVIVGRSPSAGVYLDDKTLSREHTQFYLQNGRLFVKDLESKNGTYLNGSLLQRAEALKHGRFAKSGQGACSCCFPALAGAACRCSNAITWSPCSRGCQYPSERCAACTQAFWDCTSIVE